MKEVYLAIDDESPFLDGPWLVQPFVDATHVIFEPEVTRHELDRGCWCVPEIELVDPVTEIPHVRPLVVHRSRHQIQPDE